MPTRAWLDDARHTSPTATHASPVPATTGPSQDRVRERSYAPFTSLHRVPSATCSTELFSARATPKRTPPPTTSVVPAPTRTHGPTPGPPSLGRTSAQGGAPGVPHGLGFG